MTDYSALVTLLADRSAKIGEFTLASGKKSHFYIDARLTTMSPDGLKVIGSLMRGGRSMLSEVSPSELIQFHMLSATRVRRLLIRFVRSPSARKQRHTGPQSLSKVLFMRAIALQSSRMSLRPVTRRCVRSRQRATQISS
jgi:hypothetical protein